MQGVLKNRLKEGEPLASRTSFCIGGQARFWYEPKNRRELGLFLKQPPDRLPIFVIGAGSNLLIREGMIEKIFIRLSAPDFNKIHIDGTKVTVGAGVRCGRLISALARHGLGGYEFLAGIPGTIGGALVMNAGAREDAGQRSSWREMKEIVSSVEVFGRAGRLLRLTRDEIRFGYRCSNLKSYIILAAQLSLAPAVRKTAQEKTRKLIRARIKMQDWQYPSAGSFFKNPPEGLTAGRLIDRCDLKGFRIGGAQVSSKHANFLINVDHAASSDVLELADIVRRRVYERFNIVLTPEVEVVS